jgi:RHS repeat-associated protein
MTIIQDLSSGYDYSGNVTSITDNNQSARSQMLGYDDFNRLNSASGAYGSLSFTYDGVGNRATSVAGGTTETYSYGTSSNRLTGATIGGSAVRTESYANSGQISQDVRGSDTYGFSYNNDDRLSTASLNSSTVGTYIFNGLEQRVAKTASSVTTQYVFDNAGHLMSEDNSSGNPIREYIWLDGMPVAMVDSTGMSPVIYFIHTDHLGKPQKMTDGSGSLVWDAVYKPFGEVYSVSGTATNLLMFPGQFYDSETALSQNWYRDYDATLGRYIESDPIGLDGGINTYGYANGNSIGYIDPTGQGALGAFWGGIAGEVGGGLIGSLGGGAGGTLVEPGGGTVVGGIEGGEEGAALGGYAGARAGSAFEDYILAMSKVRDASKPKAIPTSDSKPCGPSECRTISGKIVSVGTVAYRPLDTPSRPQHGIVGPHYNLYLANKNPNNGKCFWQPIGASTNLPSGAIPIEPFAN